MYQFSIVPAAHVPLTEAIETITEAELAEWYTRIEPDRLTGKRGRW